MYLYLSYGSRIKSVPNEIVERQIDIGDRVLCKNRFSLRRVRTPTDLARQNPDRIQTRTQIQTLFRHELRPSRVRYMEEEEKKRLPVKNQKWLDN